MSDTVILTHPRNRKHRDAMLQAAARLAGRMNLPAIDIGFDKTLPQRRLIAGRDDGPLFVLVSEGRRQTLKLIKRQGGNG